ncbi:alpha/beta hydrolase [Candidatus Beckwithbacteria bacterium]|nr:alpha/beta hydrolase [Candidatus Beckwithbacteria bacterium]
MNSKVYILHGWAIDENNQVKWQNFRQELEKYDIESVFLKIPGLDNKLEKPWQFSDYINWLEQELKGEKNLILLGHSFGGQLSLAFACQNPQKINKLILIDSAGIRDASWKNRIKRQIFASIAKIGKPFFGKTIAQKIFHKITGATDYSQADEIMKKTMQNVITKNIETELPKIKAETLLIWGQNDKITPVSLAKRFQKGIKNAQIQLIKEARHAPQFTHFKEIAKLIAEFLNQK